MKRMRALLVGTAIAAVMLIGLSACTSRGADGSAYLALDWTYTPPTVYFPMLPRLITAGTYYQHPAGTYYGEYTAWNWDFYAFWYTIEINEGSYGAGVWPGQDGADRFYMIFLSSWGPELYYFDGLDPAARAPEAPGAALAERGLALTLGSEPTRDLELHSQQHGPDANRLERPEEFRRVQSGPGWTLIVEGLRYPAPQRQDGPSSTEP